MRNSKHAGFDYTCQKVKPYDPDLWHIVSLGIPFSLWVFLHLFISELWRLKELGLFFSLNLAAKKKEDKRRNDFLFFHLFALCADWTLVALTAGFKFCFLWVGGSAREEEKPWKEKNLDEHELVCYFKFFNHWLSAFQLLPGYSSVS